MMKTLRMILTMVLLLAIFTANAQNDTVLFSMRGGFYEDIIQLELLNNNPQNHIRYTINGNSPDATSLLYSKRLTLDSLLYSRSNIYTIMNTIPSTFYLPESIQRSIVIRAAVFDENDSCVSQIVTNTYFIRSLGCDFHGLPVLSLAADSLALFDYETGIFIPGINYDPADSTHTGNFKMKGREWERQINMEFYEPDNRGINQQCGLRMHGGKSRCYQQKGMKLYAREEYGKKHFFFRFFNTTPVVKFKHLCLHPFRCSHWYQTGGQEYLSQTVASNLNFETMAVREIVVFINGEYWGIYTMEESSDERYLKDHYNADLEKVNMIKYWSVPYYGDPTDWQTFYSWMKESDLSQLEDSAYAFAHVDMSNFIDYMLFETFSANLDWPGNNVKIWQLETGAPFRWILYDGDGCFTWQWHNAVEFALNQGGSSVLLCHFIENGWFVQTFRERYSQLLDSYFSYDYMKSVLDEYGRLVEGEIEAQYRRFHFPSSVNKWYNDIAKVDAFLMERDANFKIELDEFFFSLEEAVKNKDILWCYPNPSTDAIHVVIDADACYADEIAVFDIMGRKVFSIPCGHTEGINEIIIQPQLSAGVYLLRAGQLTQRIVRY